MALKIVILCGGSGTRLWPISRESFPKQFNTLIGSHSLFQQTLLRNAPLLSLEDASFEIISNEQFYFLIKDQAKNISIPIASIILESIPKNTAPAIALSALNAKPEDILLILPSDHYIQDSKHYIQTIYEAIDLAKQDYLTTFGIIPTSPHTGYGYIKAKDKIVQQFVEKPDLATAKSYIESKDFYWNSGMFCFRAGTFLNELKTHAKEVFDMTKNVYDHALREDIHDDWHKSTCLRLSKDLSLNIPSISIDYALMERSKRVACVQADFKWSDIGSFDSLANEYDKSEKIPHPNILENDSKNNFILSDRFVATLGIDNLLVIDTIDSLLIAQKGRSEEIKNLIPQINTTHPHLTKFHALTYRPWGSYQVLLEAPTYKIKKILVKPQARLSLQKHCHRNEHWIIVSGNATITLEDRIFELHPNQSTYIPAGKAHRLANHGKIDLVIIEIQMGEYLGEDDIIRIEDDFKRC